VARIAGTTRSYRCPGKEVLTRGAGTL